MSDESGWMQYASAFHVVAKVGKNRKLPDEQVRAGDYFKTRTFAAQISTPLNFYQPFST
jgi:hypothetical protein